MSQADQVVQNASHIAVRADINENIKAGVSLASGATAPSVTEAYMFWADTTDNVLRQRDAGDANFNKTISTLDEVTSPINSANQIVTIADMGKLHLGNAASAPFSYTLPEIVPDINTDNFQIAFKKIDSSVNAITIAAGGSDTIDGNATFVLPTQFDSLIIRPGGATSWHVVSNFSPAGFTAGNGIDITSNVISADLDTVTPGLEFVGSLLNVNLETDPGLELVAGGLQAKAGNNITVDATGINAIGGAPDFQTTIALAANTNANLIHGLGSKPTRLLINIDGESAGGTPLGGEPVFVVNATVDTNGNGSYWGANSTAIRGRWTSWGTRVFSSSGTPLNLDLNLVFHVAAWL